MNVFQRLHSLLAMPDFSGKRRKRCRDMWNMCFRGLEIVLDVAA
jgi:hypothetical protein